MFYQDVSASSANEFMLEVLLKFFFNSLKWLKGQRSTLKYFPGKFSFSAFSGQRWMPAFPIVSCIPCYAVVSKAACQKNFQVT